MTEHEDTSQAADLSERRAEESQPVQEAGGGESEGFEEAERELIENASHEESATPDPTHLAGDAEESEPDPDAFGDADQESKEDL
jgi:hypothetical protein